MMYVPSPERCWSVEEEEEVGEDVIDECESLCKKLEESMDRFITETELTLYYKSGELSEKKTEIIGWLKDRFKEDNILYEIDCGQEDHILRQLLTHPTCKPSTMLRHSTRYKWPDKEVKRNLRVTCEQLPLNSTVLRQQLKNDRTIFTDADEYIELLHKFGFGSTMPVDVCYMWLGNTVKCISVLDRHDFPQIDSIILSRRLLSIQAKELEQESRIRSTASKKNRGVTSILSKLVASYLENSIASVKYERPLLPNIETPSFLAKRADFITDREGGTATSLSVIEEATKRLASYANAVIEERGGADAFYGDIRVVVEEIRLSCFDMSKKRVWPSSVRDLMSKMIEKRLVEDHREQQIDINTLVIKFGNEEIARTIIPSTTRPYCMINNNRGTVIINNNTLNVNINGETCENTISKKRKRMPKVSPIIEKIKRIRLATEVEEDDTLVIYRLVITKLDTTPDLTQKRYCIVCDTEKPLSSFYQKTTINRSVYHKEKNICHGCISAHAKWRKTTEIY